MKLLRAVSTLSLLASLSLGGPAHGWGTVKGRIVWDGDDAPARAAIAGVAANQDAKHCLRNGPLLSEGWVVHPKNKGVRWTFVWLSAADPKSRLDVHPDLKALKVKQVEVDQPCCQFVPHALALREGQELLVKNSAAVAHNVNWAGSNPIKNPGGNVLVPAKGQHRVNGLKTDKVPVVTLKCNIHPWMVGYVGVFDHPYFVVTDEDGRFEIKQAPDGDLRLKVWHEQIGYRGGAAGRAGIEVTIKRDETTDLGELKIRANK